MDVKSIASFFVLSTGLCLGQSFVAPDMASGPASEPKKPVIFEIVRREEQSRGHLTLVIGKYCFIDLHLVGRADLAIVVDFKNFMRDVLHTIPNGSIGRQ